MSASGKPNRTSGKDSHLFSPCWLIRVSDSVWYKYATKYAPTSRLYYEMSHKCRLSIAWRVIIGACVYTLVYDTVLPGPFGRAFRINPDQSIIRLSSADKHPIETDRMTYGKTGGYG